MINEDPWESSKNRNMRFFLLMIILSWLDPPYEKDQKSKNVKHLILINAQNKFFDAPILLQEYNSFNQSTESSLEQ